MTDIEAAIIPQLNRLATELDTRAAEVARLRRYVERTGDSMAIPEAVTAVRLTNAYRRLMGMSSMPWGKLVVNSKLDRLEVNGVTDPENPGAAQAVWDRVWQPNAMDLESKIGHRAALRDGRAHATVWPEAWDLDGDGRVIGSSGPMIQVDGAETMVVEYVEGSRRHRTGALRRWLDDSDRQHATLYRPDGIYKFRQAKTGGERSPNRWSAGGVTWEAREVEGEAWPLSNPLGVVPVVELGVNRDLAAGPFTKCCGEFANETGLIDRINLLTFLGMCIAVSMSFPLRVLFGETIKRDDGGNPVPPFDAYIGGLAQTEGHPNDVRIEEFKAADRGALSIYDELSQLAAATSTPRQYFPVSGGISNIATETLTALEAPMHAAVRGSHQPSLGEGWEEALRLGGRMLPEPVVLSDRAQLGWADHESRSLAVKADAFSKLVAGGFPWQAASALALGLNRDEIARYEQEMAGSALASLITLAREDKPAQNGTVPVANAA